MKIYVQNVTGSQKVEATLDKDSGVIIFADGEVSHVISEKAAGKKIESYVPGHHCKLLGKIKDGPKEEVKEEAEVKEESSEPQSEPSTEKKSKRKSK